ncbi:hypothetical protein DTO027I6_5293 [Penicillium roqueforti]|uniref:uncharacterized protein n=1 Tax=Penicillium roqueforti TaxID=5082 RepID=UPI0019099F04|nr:uncharacterized protein LCP9604111_6539 [Penicillium roqueforti]KAF9246779.1 hypothetical protein LCP9604111_6539 [Penicillium roqueforti]KAI2680134.1 hypothetical protein LCP963914a_7224 [Penicillium roqueforti]KAI3174269.1 hypothetical protein DTO039G3_3325 [Penicillium roqueforti]KAI3205294.1 hypothetical protein DTO027I6_5293 [Penicillium roqueforti]KAI3245590.1 hypothetical protein DTO012A7_1569 [Penicillium roqueforti]
MAGSSSPAGKPEKTMSSTLLTMKFMRRAAAAKETQSPSSDASPHNTKRPRLSTEAESPSTSDMDAIAAALAAEEEKRQKAVARAAAEAGETHWVLDFPATPQSTQQPMVLAADSLDADDDTHSGGRRAYGNFKRKERKERKPEDDENEDTIVNPSNPEEVAKMQEKSRLKAEAKAGKTRQTKLSELTSISGSGRASLLGAPSSDKKKKKRKSY